MAEQTPTSKVLTELNNYGFSDTFLWDLTKYSPKLLNDARNSYIEFIGRTFEKLVGLQVFCTNVAPMQKPFKVASFIEQHHIFVEGSYTRVADMVIAEALNYDEASELFEKTDEIISEDEILAMGETVDDHFSSYRESQRNILGKRNGRYRPISLRIVG